MKRSPTILFVVALLLFAGFAVASFRNNLTPYVTFTEAQSARRTVQVMGGLDKEKTSYDAEAEALRFSLLDEKTGATLRVRYHGVKPGNFNDAISIVAIGRWDATSSEFAAERLLVKCPSKYQGSEVEEKSYG